MMKLAEVLIQRVALNRKINQLTARIVQVATVQEGDTPQEDPKKLMRILSAAIVELEQMIVRINRINNTTVLDDDHTLMTALVRRDVLKIEIGALQQIRNAATITNYRFTTSESRSTPTLDVKKLQQEIDEMSKTLRELDIKIQAMNWVTEV